jgi:hypothetical protein
MPSRVVAAFLALFMFWSGLSTLEAPSTWAQPSPDRQQAVTHAGGLAGLDDGSVEDHHLDDLASQAQSDPPPDAPDLLPVPLRPTAPSQATVQAHTFASAAETSACLAGPLRPPAS